MGKPISKALEDAITERSSVFANGNDRGRIPVTQEQREPLYSQIMQPIISAGDTVGSVLLLGKNERDVMGESEKMLIRTASGFLGRQIKRCQIYCSHIICLLSNSHCHNNFITIIISLL